MFLFLNAAVQSFTEGTLAAGGDLSADLRLRISGFKVVDANGNEIPGVSVESDLFNPTRVPEPSTLLLLLAGMGAVASGSRRGPR